jgi:cobalamin biosynthesis Mg chelatase CobN
MTRAGVFLTAILAAASVGVFAQDSSQSASAPPQVTNQNMQNRNSSPQPGATQASTPAGSTAASQQEPSARPNQAGTNQNATNEAQSASNNGDPIQQLPQTSTILPLLGLIGLGSLVAGLFARR